jgi:putative transposase
VAKKRQQNKARKGKRSKAVEKVEKTLRCTHNRVKNLEAVEFVALREFCFRAKNLMNCGLYVARQAFFKGGWANYQAMYKKLKRHKDYKLMHSQVGQQALMAVGRDMESFSENRKAAAAEGNGRRVKLPRYKDKLGFANLRFAKQSFKVVGTQVRVSLPHDFPLIFGLRFLFFDLPPYVTKKNLKMVEIIPSKDAKFFSISFVYEPGEKEVANDVQRPIAKTEAVACENVVKAGHRPIKNEASGQAESDVSGYLAIDLGVDNLACLLNSTTGEALVVSGRPLKSLNHRYNQEKAWRQSSLDIDNRGTKWSERLELMTAKRDDRIRDALHKISKRIVAYATGQGIKEIVIGKNIGWKQSVDIGRRNNQNFVMIPHARLIDYITYKARDFGIEVVCQEESYTSKCDALACEEIEKRESYLGKRVKRGLFVSSTGRAVNSDCNGCLNILRKRLRGKCNDKSLVRGIVDKGLVFRPRMLGHGGSSGSLAL